MKNKLDKEVNKKELNDVIYLTKKILKISYFAIIAALILVVIVAIQKLNILNIILEFLKVISALFIGVILAWLLKPLVKRIDKKINNNTFSSVIVFSIFIIILIGILYIFIPTIYNEVNELVGLLPSFIEKSTNYINEIFANFYNQGLDLTEFKETLLVNITRFGTNSVQELPNFIISIVGAFFSGLGTVIMGLIIGIYMLIDYDNIYKYFLKCFPEHWRSSVDELCNNMSVEVRKCVNGTLLVAFMVLACDSIGFIIIGLNAPLLFGLLCGITDLIPYIGPYIGGAVAVVVGFTQSPLIGIGVLIICVIVQMVENYILQPIVMSKASSLHPVVIIIALLVFGHFWGIIGMILATPCLTILHVIYGFIKEKIDKKYKRI